MRFSLSMLLTLAVFHVGAADYPNWRGPSWAGSGADCGQPLKADLSQAKKLWTCKQQIPNGQSRTLRGNYTQPIIYDGKVYVPYFWPSENGALAETMFQRAKSNTKTTLNEEQMRQWCTIDADDRLACIDAASGEVLWQASMKGKGLNHSGDNTPCVHQAACAADGKVWFLGSAGMAYCVDAKTGSTVWEAEIPKQKAYYDGVREVCVKKGELTCNKKGTVPKKGGAQGLMSNPCLAGPAFVVNNGAGGLVGLDRSSGKVLWQTAKAVCGGRTSAFCWTSAGKDHVLSFTGPKLTCLDPASGAIIWQFNEFAGNGAPALVGDVLIAGGSNSKRGTVKMGINALKLTPTGASRLWKTELPNHIANHGSVAIWNGHVYAKVPSGEAKKFSMICLDLKTGKELSRTTAEAGYASLVAGDGRLIYASNNSVTLYDATPSAVKKLPGSIGRPSNSITPVLNEGILYIRMGSRLVCYSLK